MAMARKNIVVIKEDDNGEIQKNTVEGRCADETVDRLKLTPTKFIQEVTRKLKKKKD